MSRYIDADKLTDEMLKTIRAFNDHNEVYDGADALLTVKNQPTADVFEKDLLTDRPCAVCKYNTAKKGCTQWDCVFGI